jgi:hypothetical protein
MGDGVCAPDANAIERNVAMLKTMPAQVRIFAVSNEAGRLPARSLADVKGLATL